MAKLVKLIKMYFMGNEEEDIELDTTKMGNHIEIIFKWQKS